MTVVEVELAEESRTRYLTYALSVVSSRALPDVRDGLKPVQRRILYAMLHNLHLTPERAHRKSAAVVGEVLARYHPHGDGACYEAMVRMAQDFTLRYPLVDGQGNFGSLDGDPAAAYRYTEARLTDLALEVLGDIGQETVAQRDNFDQTVKEPVVLPSRVPNLLVNGASGIAVGMATAIPPHNLGEVVKALLALLEDSEAPESVVLSAVKGPDFPTGCDILNTRAELREIYRSGRGAIRMRACYKVEETKVGRTKKKNIIITAVPYGVEKSSLIEKIADLIVSRKVPQLVDVRDESTDEVRIVLEAQDGADHEKALAYLFRQTPLQQNFNVNLTALVPTKNPMTGQPLLLSLRSMLEHFIEFRVEVTRKKLEYEKARLSERVHLLEGLAAIIDVLDEVIEIVRKSDGRADAAAKLRKRFKLSEAQSLFIVDLRIYQLSRTSIAEITAELKEKNARIKEINRILGSTKALKGQVAADLQGVVEKYGDARRSRIVTDFSEPEFDKQEYVEHEDAYVIVSRDGWLKRIRTTNDPSATRLREGDALFFVEEASTRDVLLLFTNMGNVFGSLVHDLAPTTGFGEPVQKMYRFQDGEQIAAAMIVKSEANGGREETEETVPAVQESFAFGEKGKREVPRARQPQDEILLYSAHGYGFRFAVGELGLTKKTGKRVMRLGKGDVLQGVARITEKMLLLVSEQGYGNFFMVNEVPQLAGSGKGVILQRIPSGDRLVAAALVTKQAKVILGLKDGKRKHVDLTALTIGSRAKRGHKLFPRSGQVAGLC